MNIKVLLTHKFHWVRELGKNLLGTTKYRLKNYDLWKNTAISVHLVHLNRTEQIIHIEDNYTYYRMFIYTSAEILEITSFKTVRDIAKFLRENE